MTRVPSARFVAVAKLPKSRVVFHKKSEDQSGKATVVESIATDVYGDLFSIEKSDLPALRKVEGFPKGYDEKEISVVTLDGEVEAMTYVSTKAAYDESQIPYDWYVDLIRFWGRS